MDEKTSIENFEFESREDYDRAVKELEFINKVRENADLSIGDNAYMVYKKAVTDKMFHTVAGYFFLQELRQTIIQSGVAPEEELGDIPVRATENSGQDTLSGNTFMENRFRRLYEGQRILNKKFKIAIVALVILLASFVFINFRFEYSIFTFFTNYKANMEEELINKYEHWQSQLEEREKNLQGDAGQNMAEPDSSPSQTPQ